MLNYVLVCEKEKNFFDEEIIQDVFKVYPSCEWVSSSNKTSSEFIVDCFDQKVLYEKASALNRGMGTVMTIVPYILGYNECFSKHVRK